MIRRPPRSTLFPLHDALPILASFKKGDKPLALITDCDETVIENSIYDAGFIDHNDCHKDRKSTRLNSSHANISYAVFCLQKKHTCIRPGVRICGAVVQGGACP